MENFGKIIIRNLVKVMKYGIKSLTLFFFLLVLHTNLSGQTYCTPGYTYGNGSGDYISCVRIGTINNTSGKAPLPNYYSDFTSQNATLILNNNSTIYITNGTYSTDIFYVWIDYNHDYDFSDPGELVGQVTSSASSQTNSINFTVPPSALTGSARLRVRCIYNSTADPCATRSYGETEDYSVNILQRFSSKSSLSYVGYYNSALWTDCNNDGYLDALYTNGTTLHVYQNNSGATFSDVNTGLPGPKQGVIAPCDYNRDGNIDILVSGTSENSVNPTVYFSKIYKNTGGAFTDISAGLPSLYQSSADWGDFDNDGDQDILISGLGTVDPLTKIFENKGSDVFAEYTCTLKGASEGDCMWWDFNNDGYLDIIVSGLNIDGNSEIAVYQNLSGKGFSRISYPFLNIPGSFDIGDYDQDGDPDIIIAGEENLQPSVGGSPKTALYRNDGNGNFSLVNTGIQNMREADVKFGDIDNDGDLDIIIIGRYVYYADKYIQLYKNNGNDSFELEPVSMTPVYGGELDLGDFDNDNDLDFLYTGNDNILRIIENSIASYLPNNPPSPPTVLSSKMVGNGIQLTFSSGTDNKSLAGGLTYNVKVGTSPGAINIVSPAVNSSSGRMKFTSMGNVNQNKTVLISGLNTGTYYWSVQSVDQSYACSAFSTEQSVTVTEPFTEIDPGFTKVSYGKVQWADLNSDDKPDLISTGTTSGPSTPTPSTSIWFKGTGDSFTAYSGNSSLEQVWYSSISVADYDRDNDMDIYIYGRNSSGQNVSKLYKNTAGSFSSVTYPFGVTGDAQFGDMDNDGDIDVLIGSSLYINNGSNTYTLSGVPYGSLNILFDSDNDGDLDIYSYYSGKLLINNGSGGFSVSAAVFPALNDVSADVGDYDNDNDLDILVSGYSNASRYSYIYRNNNDGTFTDIHANIRAVEEGTVKWIDYNNDGYPDVSMTGASSTQITRIFINKGNDIFEPLSVNLPEYYDSDFDWVDYDNDADMDLIYSGRISTPSITNIYRNNNNYPNPSPSIPLHLGASVNGQTATLRWDRSFNPSDTIETMSYNIRVGTSPGAFNIVSPQSSLVTGKPFVHSLGNAQMVKMKILKNLPVGTYYWSVQALDKNSNYSSWATESSFEISVLQAEFNATGVCKGVANSFTDQSFASGVTIDSWHYDFGDGTFSDAANPTHVYASDGTYNVTLTITSGVYSDNITKQVYVYKKPVAGFNANIACQGIETSFTNTTSLNDLTVSEWSWDFGDGKTSTLQTPVNPGLLIAGNYNVRLKVTTSEHACADEIIKIVTVAPYPSAVISVNGPVNFCNGDSVTLSAPSEATYLYTWQMNGVPVTGAISNAYKAKQTGNYSVRIINPAGNCQQTSGIISVNTAPAPSRPFINLSGSNNFCEGDSAKLFVTEISSNNYQWLKNGGTVGIDNSSYYPQTSGSYNLIVSNSSGCSAYSVNTINIAVNPRPSSRTISTSGITTFCQGNSVTLNVIPQNDCSYTWRNESGPLTGAFSDSYVANVTGVYRLDITNINGCTITTAPVNVVVKPSPVKPVIQAQNYTQGQCPGLNPVKLGTQDIQGYSYRWMVNGIIQPKETSPYIEFYEPGNFRLIADLDGCQDTSTVFTASFPQGPERPVIYAEGPSAWYLASSVMDAKYYKWYYNGSLVEGADKYYYMANRNLGVYRVSVGDENGCYTKSDSLAIPLVYTDIDDSRANEGVNIYPNPSSGIVFIELENSFTGRVRAEVFTQAGKKVISKEFEKPEGHLREMIDMTGQSKGMYLITIKINGYTISKKVLIE